MRTAGRRKDRAPSLPDGGILQPLRKRPIPDLQAGLGTGPGRPPGHGSVRAGSRIDAGKRGNAVRVLARAAVLAATAPCSLAGQGTEMVRVSVTVPPAVTLSPVTAAVDFAIVEEAQNWAEGQASVALNQAGNVSRVVEVRGFRVVRAPASGVGVPVEFQARVDDGPWVAVEGDTSLWSADTDAGRGTIIVHHRIRGVDVPLPAGTWEVELEYGIQVGPGS